MNIKEVVTMRDELLDRMVEDFRAAYIAAGVAEIDDADAPKIVRAILDDIGGDEGVIGEYYFTPSSEDDEIMIFNAILTLSETLPDDNLAAVYEAMSYRNCAVPVGSFAYDKDHSFVGYRLSVSMPTSFDSEAVYSLMNIAVGNSVSVAETYTDVLIGVATGTVSIDEVKHILGGKE